MQPGLRLLRLQEREYTVSLTRAQHICTRSTILHVEKDPIQEPMSRVHQDLQNRDGKECLAVSLCAFLFTSEAST